MMVIFLHFIDFKCFLMQVSLINILQSLIQFVIICFKENIYMKAT